MPETRRTTLKVIIGSLAAALIGSGSVWQLVEWKYKSQSANFEKMKVVNDFRQDKDQVYSEIIKLTEEYMQAINKINKTPDESLKRDLKSKIKSLHAHLAIKKSNFSVIEKSLAKLERREPEQINLKFFVPPPYDFRIVTR